MKPDTRNMANSDTMSKEKRRFSQRSQRRTVPLCSCSDMRPPHGQHGPFLSETRTCEKTMNSNRIPVGQEPDRRGTMYRNVLVPLDGSNFGEQALPAAISIAKRSGGNIHL